jgi:hypothetical protein
MIRTSLLFIALVTFVGCKKKEESGAASTDKPSEPAPTAAKPAPAPAPAAGPKVFEYATAQALDDDYRSVKGAAFMDKFGLDGKFRVTSAVETVITEPSGNTKVGLKLDGNKTVLLDFTDGGKGVAAKNMKKGDAIKVLCDAAGSDDNMIMLTRCEVE